MTNESDVVSIIAPPAHLESAARIVERVLGMNPPYCGFELESHLWPYPQSTHMALGDLIEHVILTTWREAVRRRPRIMVNVAQEELLWPFSIRQLEVIPIGLLVTSEPHSPLCVYSDPVWHRPVSDEIFKDVGHSKMLALRAGLGGRDPYMVELSHTICGDLMKALLLESESKFVTRQ